MSTPGSGLDSARRLRSFSVMCHHRLQPPSYFSATSNSRVAFSLSSCVDIKIYPTKLRKIVRRKKRLCQLTLRSVPALELNLVAVNTLLFLGSTAPTATSGVSTSATSFGGAVKIAARPNLIGNPSAPIALVFNGVCGVPERDKGESNDDKGVPGVASE